MARLTCQVLFKPGRITVVWSEGTAFFEPFHLEGGEVDRVEELSRALRQRLTQAVHAVEEQSADELAGLGHQLFRTLFRLDAKDAAAQAAHDFWLKRRGELKSLDFLSNAPGRIPWSMVCDEAGAEAKAFWGFRYPLAEGRRVSPFHTRSGLQAPTALLMLEERGDAKGKLQAWAQERQLPVMASARDFADALTERSADVLYVSARADKGQLHWRDQRLALDEMLQSIADSDKDAPLLVLALCGGADAGASWECLVGALTQSSAALVYPLVPLPAEKAQRLSEAWLPGFFQGGISLGEALRRARADAGINGLAWSLLAPAWLTVNGTADDDASLTPMARPLPEAPYASLAALDREQRMFLAGRQDDVARCAKALDEPGTQGLLLHGGMATGKTSFLRAGLLPFLEEESVGFRALRDRSSAEGEDDEAVLALRMGPDLLGQLCQGLAYFATQPLEYATPAGAIVRLDLPGYLARAAAHPESSMAVRAGKPGESAGAAPFVTRGEIESKPAQWAQQLYQIGKENPDTFLAIVDELTRRLPWEVVFVLEQAEDLVDASTPTVAKRRREALRLLSRLAASAARLKVVLAARTDALGQLLALLPARERGAWREFFLPPLPREAIEEAVLLPTATEPIAYAEAPPHSKYQFFIEEGLAATLVGDSLKAARQHQLAPLPLVQAVVAELYKKMRSRGDNTMRAAVLRSLEPLEDVPLKVIDDVLTRESVPKAETRNLLDTLIRLEPDGTCRREIASTRTLAASWPGGALDAALEKLAQSAPPLVEIQQFLVNGEPDTQASVANDSVAQARRRAIEVKAMRAHGWTRVVDTLWIMIPLAALAAAISFFLTRRYDNVANREAFEKAEAELETKANTFIKQALDIHEEDAFAYHRAMTQAHYSGSMARAELALGRGALLEARAQMFSVLPHDHPPKRTIDRRAWNFGREDLRGFDWYHLWRRMHPERYVLQGHPSSVSSVTLSPDGKLIASASLDGTIKLWNRDTLLEIQTIAGEKVPVLSVAFTADGKALAAARKDKLIHVWEVSSDKEGVKLAAKPAVWKGHDADVVALCSAKGQALASADSSGKVIAWDEAKGEPLHTASLAGGVRALTYGADGRLFALGEKGSVAFFDLTKGKDKQGTFEPGLAEADAFAWNSEKGVLGISGKSATDAKTTLVVLDAGGKQVGASLQLKSPARTLVWLPGKNALVAGNRDHTVTLVDRDENRVTRTLRSHLGWVNTLTAASDGMVLSGGEDASSGGIKVWSLSPEFEPETVKVNDGEIRALAFVADGKVLASGDSAGQVQFLDPATGRVLGKVSKSGHQVSAFAVLEEKDQTKLAVGFAKGKESGVVLFVDVKMDEKKGLQLTEGDPLAGLTRAPTALAFGDEGKMLAVAAGGGSLLVWDLGKKAVAADVDSAKTDLDVIAWVAGNLVAGAAGDEIVLVDVKDAKAAKKLVAQKAHAGAITGLLELPSSTAGNVRFATLGKDRVVQVWEWFDNKLLSPMARAIFTASPCNLARSPTSAMLLVGVDGGVQPLDFARGDGIFEFRERLMLLGAKAAPRFVAINPAQTVIAAGLEDGTIRFWRAATAEETLNPKPR